MPDKQTILHKFPIKNYLIVLLLCPAVLFAQPASLDTTFSIGSGANHGINEIIIQPDDKVIVAGMFSSFNGTTANRIIRLMPDGATDITWNSTGGGADFDIRASALQPDGKVLIGGIFSTYNGVAANRLVRLDSAGNTDPAFAVGAGPNNEVQGITVNNNRVVIQGFFNQYQGTPVPNFAVLQMNGALDTSFSMPSESFISVRDFHILPNDQLYLGGNFVTYNGQVVKRIVRLNPDGSIDTSFNTGSGLDAMVSRLLVQNNGDVLVAGTFSTYNGSPVSRLIRLKPNGDRDTSFNAVVPSIATIAALTIDTAGRVYLTGSDAGMLFLKRLLPDGSPDPAFNTGTGFNGNITQIAHQSNQKVLVTGNFTLYQNQQQAGRVARLFTDQPVIIGTENNFMEEDVKLFPNPAADKIHLKLNSNPGIIYLKIKDIQGRQFFEGTYNNEENIALNTAEWLPGIYLLEIVNAKGNYRVVKLVKL